MMRRMTPSDVESVVSAADAAAAVLARIASLERQLADAHAFIKSKDWWDEFVNDTPERKQMRRMGVDPDDLGPALPFGE